MNKTKIALSFLIACSCRNSDKSIKPIPNEKITENRDKDSTYYFLDRALDSGDRNQKDISELDLRTKNLALYYLLRAYEVNYEDSKSEVKLLFRYNS